MKRLFILTACLLTACTVQQPRYTVANSGRDYIECRRLALEEVEQQGLGNNMFKEMLLTPQVNECVEALKGSRR